MPLDQHQPESATTSEEFLSTQWKVLAVKRKDVKDSGDGTVTMSFEIAAKDLPVEYASSPDGSLWEIRMEDVESPEPMTFKATRHGIKDMPKGRLEIRFDTVVGGLPIERVYGRRNEDETLSIRLLAGRAPYPHLVDRSERSAVLRRAAVTCTDPSFCAWVASEAGRQGFPTIPTRDIPAALDMPEDDYEAARAAENLCRVARIHSRAEVLTSNAAAERVETIIRAYRDWLWQQRRLEQQEEDRQRGVRR